MLDIVDVVSIKFVSSISSSYTTSCNYTCLLVLKAKVYYSKDRATRGLSVFKIKTMKVKLFQLKLVELEID